MIKIVRAGAAGVLLALGAAAPAAAATVDVRVEGQASTLLPLTTVTPPATSEPHTGCSADSAANALNTAVKGNWDGQPFTQTILGETHKFDNSDYWALWVFRGGRYQVANGICDEKLSAGEELLAAYQVSGPAPDYANVYFPMWLEGVPATVAPAQPFTVTVAQTACDTAGCLPGEGRRVVRSGATVTAGAVTATSGADGRATLSLNARGPVGLRATATGGTPTATKTVCVTDGADGYCGTSAPGAPPKPAPGGDGPPAIGCQTTGDDGLCGTPDRRPAHARITGIREQQKFRRAKAPREITATVDEDPSGLHMVKLALTRSHGGRCWALSRKRDAFRRARCGHHPLFRAADRAPLSYLLPGRLKPGRYVLDVVAIDGALNRDPLARGRNRIVFHVR